MKLLSEFYPRILPYAPGCPEPVAAQCLVDAAIHFCDESLVLRQTQAPISTVAGTIGYTIPDSTFETVARIISVRIDGSVIQPLAVNDNTYIPATVQRAQPVGYYTTNIDGVFRLNLYPTPDKVYTVSVEAAMRPLRGAAQLEDDLLNFWIDGVAAGALARIKEIPGQAYSDPMAAMSYKAQATVLARKARVEGSVGRVRATQSVKMRAFA